MTYSSRYSFIASQFPVRLVFPGFTEYQTKYYFPMFSGLKGMQTESKGILLDRHRRRMPELSRCSEGRLHLRVG